MDCLTIKKENRCYRNPRSGCFQLNANSQCHKTSAASLLDALVETLLITNDGLNRLVTYFNPVIDQQFRNDLPNAACYIEYVLIPVFSQYLRQPLQIRQRPDTCAVEVDILNRKK